MDVKADIEGLAMAYIAADVAMRDAIDRDHGEQERAHRRCDAEQDRCSAALAVQGVRIALIHADPEQGYRMCGLTVEASGSQSLIGRKPAWELAADVEREEAERARLAREEQARNDCLRAIGMTIDEARAALGSRATREAWDVYQCMRAAEARASIARGGGGAGQWGIALDGRADEHAAYCIAVQGVRGADEARERWSRQIATLDRIARGWPHRRGEIAS